MKKFFLVAAALASTVALNAQVSLADIAADPCQSANNLRCYPSDEIVPLTPVPMGYTPFYIYYIGRHGSRYHAGESSYTKPLKMLQDAHDAHALSAKGEEVYQKAQFLYDDAKGRVGQLTDVGENQLRGIAERMYFNYPQVFRDGSVLECRTTTSHRVINTMWSFVERMKELSPGLVVIRDAGNHEQFEWGGDSSAMEALVGNDTEYSRISDQLFNDAVQEQRVMKLLFNKPDRYVEKSGLDAKRFVYELYSLNGIVQDTDVDFDKWNFYDIFTPEELFNMSKIGNYHYYVHYGASEYSRAAKSPMPAAIVDLMVRYADEAIEAGTPAATLRFCHDGNVGPLASFLKVPCALSDQSDPDKLSEEYSASDVVPMATNFQLIFFRNAEGDIIVKPLFCEKEVKIPAKTDMYPYYKWEDMKAYLLGLVNDVK